MKDSANPFATVIIPMLIVKDGNAAIDFYRKAFGAIELNRWANPDGTVHVAELKVDDARFFLRRDSPHFHHINPLETRFNTSLLNFLQMTLIP